MDHSLAGDEGDRMKGDGAENAVERVTLLLGGLAGIEAAGGKTEVEVL